MVECRRRGFGGRLHLQLPLALVGCYYRHGLLSRVWHDAMIVAVSCLFVWPYEAYQAHHRSTSTPASRRVQIMPPTIQDFHHLVVSVNITQYYSILLNIKPYCSLPTNTQTISHQ